MGQMIKVAQTGNLPPGKAMCVEVEGEMVALFNVGGTYYAIADTCTHSGGPLSEGEVDGSVVTCPWHAAEFDLTTGEVLSPPAYEGVTSYRVEVDGDDIKIELP